MSLGGHSTNATFAPDNVSYEGVFKAGSGGVAAAVRVSEVRFRRMGCAVRAKAAIRLRGRAR